MHRVLILLAVFCLAACSGLPFNAVAPKVRVAEVNIISLGFFEQRFDVGLRITNPNDFDLTIEALDFELEVNGRPFAAGFRRPRHGLQRSPRRCCGSTPSRNRRT